MKVDCKMGHWQVVAFGKRWCVIAMQVSALMSGGLTTKAR